MSILSISAEALLVYHKQLDEICVTAIIMIPTRVPIEQLSRYLYDFLNASQDIPIASKQNLPFRACRRESLT
jgi:hypothetical protein